MAKRQFFAIVALCLLATAQPLPQPQLDILGSLLQPVVGVVGGVADALVGVTKPLEGILGTVTGLLDSVTKALSDTLGTVVDSLESSLGDLANQPLQALTGLEAVVSSALSPLKLIGEVTNALNLKAVTDIVGQLGKAVGCVTTTAVSRITSGTIKGVLDILKCAKPLVNELKNVTELVKVIVDDALKLVQGALQDISNCAKQVSNPPDLGNIVGCIVNTVSRAVEKVAALVEKAKPYIISAVNAVVKVVECILKTLLDGLGQTGALVQSLTACASQQGVNVTQPSLPNVTVNFTAIANKTLAAVLEITSAAVGANSPLANLTAAIAKLQNATSSVSPVAVAVTVNSSIANISAQIAVAANGSASPNLAACVAAAQQSANNLAPAGVEDIVSCAQTIGPDAVGLVTEAGKLELLLKADAVKAPTEVFAKCAESATSLDDTVQKCFDGALAAVKSNVDSLESQIKKITADADKLIANSKDCLDKGQAKLVDQGNAIISTLQQCLA